MASIGEVRKKIHKEFLDELYSLFSPGTADKILQSFGGERLTTLRVNTLKVDIARLMKYFRERDFKFERVGWYRDALVLKNKKEKDVTELDVYKEGLIYLQSLSSMIPPLVLGPVQGERILDMTAAPGSKTTQITALMNNKGYILANDIDCIRLERLKYNLKLQGSEIADVKSGDGVRLGKLLPEAFDRVLLDAPCSGEGRFLITEPVSFKGWSTKEVERLSRLQRKLFESGFKALRRGGIMVYSTCTINRRENEDIILWASEKFEFEILDIKINVQSSIPAIDNGVKNMKSCLRILPTREMEGFFVCKLRKL